MSVPRFTKTIVGELDNSALEASMNTFFTVGDVNGDGYPDIVTSGRNGLMAWFANPGLNGGEWTRHIVAQVSNQECGGLVYDLTGDGLGDIINGGDWRSHELCWWENPGPTGSMWERRIITEAPGNQFHDEALGDVTGEGRLSLLFCNQGSATLFRVPVPSDPRITPWPDVEVIATDLRENGQPEEGLIVADVDHDGRNEIITGTRWFKYRDGRWEQHKFAEGYITTMIAFTDVDGDGRNEILLSEGDPCIYGHPEGGKFAWFKPGADITALWEEHLVEEHLLDAHSLQVGDICGNGYRDVLVGEIGVRETYTEKPPRLLVFENDGKGNFTRHVIDEGTGTHHARLVDLRRRGVPDIVSRPLHGPEKWNIIAWINERG